MPRFRAIRPVILAMAIGCLGLSGAARAAEAPPPAGERIVQGSNQALFDGNPLGTALALLFAVAVAYGIYDVLLDDDQDDEPASP